MNEKELYQFLEKVDRLFPVPLSSKTDLKLYVQKLCDFADIICYKIDDVVKGIVAGYISNSTNDLAYVSVLAVLPEEQGKGIGKWLINSFIKKAKQYNKHGVHLYAVQSNKSAMALYTGVGFQKYIIEDENRPDDIHLVYWMGESV